MTRSKIRPIIFTIALVTFLSSNSAAGQPPSSSTNNGVQVVAQDSHSSSIHSVAISKDNRFAFTNSGSETIVWDVESGIAIKKYDTDGATVLRGETAQAYTFRSGGELVVWDLLTGKTLGQTKTGMKRKKYSHDGLSFDILPLGNRVMITRSVLGRHHKKSRQKSRKHTYTLVDINTKKVVKYDDSIACLKSSNLAFTQDETKAFASCGDRLLFWDLESGKKIWEHDLNYNDYFPRYFPRIFPDGKRVVLARKDFIHKPKDLKRALILFDLQKKKVIGTYRMQANIDAIRILSDNRRAAIMHQEGLIQVFDFRLGKVVRTIKNTASMIAGGVEVSSDDKLILGISDGSSTASIWKLENGRKLQVFEGTGREGSFFYVEASPVDMHVVTNTLGHDLYLWDISTLQMVHAFDRRRKEGYRRMKISPNRQVVATYEYGFEVWDIQSKQLAKQFEWDSKSFEANDIAVSANGELAAISASKENGWAGIYDARSWEMISETPVRFDGDNLRLSPNGRFLLTEYNGFDLERGIRTHRESKFKPIGGEFLPDGKHIIFINDGMVGMWEFATGKLVKLFVLDEKSPGVKKMKLSPDGSRIATWNGNSDYDVWDVKSGKRLFSYRNHRIGEASDFAFLKSNKHIVKTSSKGEIKVWNFEKDKAVTLTCNGSDWLIYTDDGYFDASRRGGRQIALVDDLESYRIDQLAVRYNRPDIILSRMELGTPELIAHYKSLYEKRLRKLGLKEEQLKARFQKAPIAQILKAQKTGKHVDLSFEVSDNFSQLARVNVYVNDVPIFGSAGKAVTGRHQVLEQRIELLNGKNQIEVSALNTLGVESLRDSYLVQHSTSAKGDLYYLGFGVSRYQDHQLNLKYASKDVVDLEQVFSKAGKHFKNIHTRVLTDEQVTKAAIVKSRDFLSAATVQDTVVLFVAGHGLYAEGGSEYYYLTNEADLDNLEGSAVSFESIEGLLQTIAPRQKLLLLDTCQSGEMDSSYELAALNSANQQGLVSRGIQRVGASRSTNQSFLAVDRSRYIYNDLFRRTGAIVFSSSRGTELSYERDDIQNGLFTEELITALTTPVADSDRNRAISTEELRRHVSKAVTKKTGGLQNPTVDRDNIAALFSFPVVK